MKNLKTIILLFLSVILFSFQKNDTSEFQKDKPLSENKVVGTILVRSILVTYSPTSTTATKEYIKDQLRLTYGDFVVRLNTRNSEVLLLHNPYLLTLEYIDYPNDLNDEDAQDIIMPPPPDPIMQTATYVFNPTFN
ncbi:MAG: hypothetical protein JXR05_07530 [Flavobacteriaceae bacterium]